MEIEENTEGQAPPENTEGGEGTGGENTPPAEGVNLQIPDSPPEGSTGQVGQLSQEKMDAYASEIVANGGSLGEDSIKELEGLGYARELIQGYVAGMWSQRQNENVTVSKALGGDENIKKALGFAATLPEVERKALQEGLDGGSTETRITIMQGLLARSGHRTTLNGGGGKGSDGGGIKPFADHNEYHAAIADPKYNQSQEYRDQVMERLRISTAI